MENLLSSVPSLEGHFRLESGYHTSVWLTLDAVFTDQAGIAPLVGALAARLHPHGASAVCGPFVGGALPRAATRRCTRCAFFLPAAGSGAANDWPVQSREYYLTPELQRRIGGERLAVVDEMISGGSSVRATIAAASEAGASVVVVGALVVLGDTALRHFAGINMSKPSSNGLSRCGHRRNAHSAPPVCRWRRHEGGPLR